MKLVIFILIGLVLIWLFFLRNKSDSKRTLEKKVPVVHGKYHCVMVHFNKSACDAIKEFEGKRILSAEAPLSRCDADMSLSL